MRAKAFLNQLDDQRIVAAITESERHTSGQIRVYISRKDVEDALTRAKARFMALGMDKTRDRNAVLIYFAPRSHQFAVVGDAGVHERCGDDFWRQLTAAMGAALKNRQFTEAVILAVERCGALLAEHFPPRPDGSNELPNEVEGD
ncbi:MAG: TPM domain-containing protein [Chthoniobacteraceae bacterium]|nr:TPM domain-containing protein [Chthoniobacteraceae bacterium]